MDDKEVVRLVGQYLHEHGFTNTLRELEEERCVANYKHSVHVQCSSVQACHVFVYSCH